MIAPDTSVLIAGFDSTHPFFAQAEAALSEVRRDGRLGPTPSPRRLRC